MLEEAIKSIMIPEYHDHIIYIHNFSKFDAVFLITTIANVFKDVTPVIRDGRVIDLKVKFNGYNLYFRDSILLLPDSLKKMGKAFNVKVTKDIFPFNFVNNPKINLNYKGVVPGFKYFNNITLEEYNTYVERFNNKWNLKDELLNYCVKDCISLWQIISKFNSEIWDLFKLDLTNYPTTPSLAFGIYRKNYISNFRIPIIEGEIYDHIVKAYYGGRTDMFIPTNSENEKVNAYDVNSLYPDSMANHDMPTGAPNYFEGDIYIIDKEAFGFFEVDITTPVLNIPFLPYKHTKGFNRNIFPIGSWRGWYSSEEIRKAIELGYDITILRGYTFEKRKIFSSYVQTLYKMKENSPKGSLRYIIAKLLLNSLYGRLGMSPIMSKHIIVDKNESIKIFNTDVIVDRIPLLKIDKEILSIKNNESDASHLNISVGVSAMITSISRIKMYNYF